MNFVVFLVIAGASARHVLDAEYRNGNSDAVGLNVGYLNRGSPGTYVNTDARQGDNEFSEKNNQFSHFDDVKQNSDSFNNISDNENNEYRLRTNAYTTEVYSATERIVQHKVYTNSRETEDKDERKSHKQRKLHREQQEHRSSGLTPSRQPENRPVICNRERGYQEKPSNVNKPYHYPRPEGRPLNHDQDRGVVETSSINNDTQILTRPENRPIVNKKESVYPGMENVNKSIQNIKTNIDTTNTEQSFKPDNETVIVKPILSNETRQDRIPTPRINETDLPKTDDEQIWVWGTERSKVSSIEPGSLDDRAAFSGDKCPTGKAKVNGICVEKD